MFKAGKGYVKNAGSKKLFDGRNSQRIGQGFNYIYKLS